MDWENRWDPRNLTLTLGKVGSSEPHESKGFFELTALAAATVVFGIAPAASAAPIDLSCTVGSEGSKTTNITAIDPAADFSVTKSVLGLSRKPVNRFRDIITSKATVAGYPFCWIDDLSKNTEITKSDHPLLGGGKTSTTTCTRVPRPQNW
ncbi:hypothetical protein [Synechococcus sp. CCY 9618]|uniref:hypothetical protein n=1 Tax=Synechococcus sp. CCY 9618 TaxID=2815602 RepID=UPI001C234B51|nr:hypothetical protein [Synechococcus sp. CCY 9618]